MVELEDIKAEIEDIGYDVLNGEYYSVLCSESALQ